MKILIATIFCIFMLGCHTPAVQERIYSSVDVETTGLSAKKERIIEIAVVKFSETKVYEEASWLINPERHIPSRATAVHGITDDMVKDEPPIIHVLPAFCDMVTGTTIIAHNARFDVAFLNAELERAGQPSLEPTVIDTLPLFRKWFPEADSHSLKSLSTIFATSNTQEHRALADADCLRRLFLHGLKSQPLSRDI